ncbi:GlxA family transcriptional regulator [Mucilaginibacter ginsenosidivorans]|uniref:Helix-turn-helix domain-containing protein n=1 Tax=Mucilaginibacter ginsenosidivorans TaxID=398053 RepID=A0A5B8V0P9_9SPHI|nr:helix-turn-helix domain-containing protein [Mucilaginibacter ginsenosidivorans]QEC64924.1 helix-turn-helix domain-containing protein [Mucilaginibacter ginsenosidivorans]
MKTVSILVPESAVLQGIADPRYIFTAVNQFLENSGKPPLFRVQLVGCTPEVKLNGGAFSIRTDLLLDEVKRSDLVIVPPLFGDLDAGIKLNRELLPWIIDQYDGGAEVASLCLGAFLLASTGLLNGRKCSTHWFFANQFRNMFPDVELVDEKIITEEGHVYSSGGANSYWNLLLYLVEKYTDREMAILAAKYFVIDIGRNDQSPFTIFKGQKDHEDELVKNAQEYIEQNFQQKISVDELSERFNIVRRTFERRFKKSTHNTVVEYIQRVKIEAAKKSFESNRKTIYEVMYDVGYTDIKAFRDVFKKITGMPPVDYRNKYNKNALVA